MNVREQFDIDSLWDYDDPAASESRFRELLPQIAESGDDAVLAELFTQIARTEGLQRRFSDAEQTLERAEALITDGMPRARVRYLLEKGRMLNSSGQRQEAFPCFLDALDLAQSAGEDFLAVDAAHMLGIVAPGGDGLEWNVRAIELAEGSQNERARGWLGSLYNNIAWSQHGLGQYEEAHRYFLLGLEFRRDRGDERLIRIASWTVGRSLRSLGRLDEALEMQRQNLAAVRAAGDPEGFGNEEIAECLLALGRDEESRPHFAVAYEVLSQDPWLAEGEPERLERLRRLSGDDASKSAADG